ncbi:MAG: XrtA-associated ATPase [Thermodesulfovibrionales bacterium]|nr:XrtA-associated ATPase [Thermodesulfovibrionales bacterium]
MYNSFFGFRENPFQLTPDPDFFYSGRAHRRALTYLEYGMLSSCNFIVISGEIGTGKTTLIRAFLKKISNAVDVASLSHTMLTSSQLISMINQEFGLKIENRDKPVLLKDLTDFLINNYIEEKKTLLIIDEAHNLSYDQLEEIRLLSNLETEKEKLLKIILVGQPELDRKLASPQLAQLRQRIAVYTHLNPLSREEMEEYIFHRLEIAGNRDAVKFEDGVMEQIFEYSKGVPRLVNILCDFLLLIAFSEKTKVINSSVVSDVIKDLGNRPDIKMASDTIKNVNGDFRKIKEALVRCDLKIRQLELVVSEIYKKVYG